MLDIVQDCIDIPSPGNNLCRFGFCLPRTHSSVLLVMRSARDIWMLFLFLLLSVRSVLSLHISLRCLKKLLVLYFHSWFEI